MFEKQKRLNEANDHDDDINIEPKKLEIQNISPENIEPPNIEPENIEPEIKGHQNIDTKIIEPQNKCENDMFKKKCQFKSDFEQQNF